MHYGIEVVPFGDFSDPRVLVKLAREAEAAGWEGFWIWDHLVISYGAADPWVALSAVAAVTSKLKLVTGVSPLPRYRPHLLARSLASLDILSSGRVIFGAGLGIPSDFVPFAEPAEDKVRGEMLDEGLDLLTAYLSGTQVSHHGRYYRAEDVRIFPNPVQQPRIPIWIGGDSRAALRRASRWDGWIIGTVDENSRVTHPPDKLATNLAYIQKFQKDGGKFDVAVDGVTDPGSSGLAPEFQQAGATWWFEIIHLLRGTQEEMVRRIQAGPPCI
jgi:alkanesulfonate monooxygenase SsuD/methylene tetrahydromethanopterin reductase-like flavin-dependent oxidoreductase (luciferase family)